MTTLVTKEITIAAKIADQKLLVRWGALALSFWVATALIPGIDVQGGFTTYFWVALLFGLLNATLGSLIKLLTLPAVILTLGLFLVVVNAAILMCSGHTSVQHFVMLQKPRPCCSCASCLRVLR